MMAHDEFLIILGVITGDSPGMLCILIDCAYKPEYRQLILSVIITTTIIFEIIGPLITRICVIKTARQ